MRAVIAAPTKFLEQTLRRPALTPGEPTVPFSRISVSISTHSPSFGAGCTPRSCLNSV
jgi:hypothetical protein